MVKGIYGVYDLVSGDLVGPLWLFPSDRPAERMLSDLVRAPDSMVSQHPDDFCLVKVGSIDLETLQVIDVYSGSDAVRLASHGDKGHRGVLLSARDVVPASPAGSASPSVAAVD